MEMFSWLTDGTIGSYKSRAVARYGENHDDLVIDTCEVYDGAQPFETGIKTPRYPGWCIVEAYDTREEAQAGHDRWVATMTGPNAPERLHDCANAKIAQAMDKLGWLNDEDGYLIESEDE